MNLLNYCLNKFCPFLIIGGLCFYGFGWWAFEPYAILLSAIYVGRFEYKSGYAMAWCEHNGFNRDS